ncbi:hypothetical protein ACLKA6_011094 [Drosophila palustris]
MCLPWPQNNGGSSSRCGGNRNTIPKMKVALSGSMFPAVHGRHGTESRSEWHATSALCIYFRSITRDKNRIKYKMKTRKRSSRSLGSNVMSSSKHKDMTQNKPK